MVARIASAQFRLQADVGFGDAVTPRASLVVSPTLLDFPAPRLLAYPRETVIAKNLEAIVQLGMANSRMKDFYDIAALSKLFEVDGQLLVDAIRATLSRRRTDIPIDMPVAFTSTFTADSTKNTQWTAFVRKSGVDHAADLATTVTAVIAFLQEPLAASATRSSFDLHWRFGSGWG